MAKITAAGFDTSQVPATATADQLQSWYDEAMQALAGASGGAPTNTATPPTTGSASDTIKAASKSSDPYQYDPSIIKAKNGVAMMEKHGISGPSWVKGGKSSAEKAAYARALANQTIDSKTMSAATIAAIKRARKWYTGGYTEGASKNSPPKYAKGSVKDILMGPGRGGQVVKPGTKPSGGGGGGVGGNPATAVRNRSNGKIDRTVNPKEPPIRVVKPNLINGATDTPKNTASPTKATAPANTLPSGAVGPTNPTTTAASKALKRASNFLAQNVVNPTARPGSNGPQGTGVADSVTSSVAKDLAGWGAANPNPKKRKTPGAGL
jgi:hypothetical protein